MEKIQSVRGGI